MSSQYCQFSFILYSDFILSTLVDMLAFVTFSKIKIISRLIARFSKFFSALYIIFQGSVRVAGAISLFLCLFFAYVWILILCLNCFIWFHLFFICFPVVIVVKGNFFRFLVFYP
jgi:hypothetical protein